MNADERGSACGRSQIDSRRDAETQRTPSHHHLSKPSAAAPLREILFVVLKSTCIMAPELSGRNFQLLRGTPRKWRVCDPASCPSCSSWFHMTEDGRASRPWGLQQTKPRRARRARRMKGHVPRTTRYETRTTRFYVEPQMNADNFFLDRDLREMDTDSTFHTKARSHEEDQYSIVNQK